MKMRTAAALLLALCPAGLLAFAGTGGATSPRAGSAATTAPAAGAIEGRLTVAAAPARRTLNRYPDEYGGGGAVQQVPAVVYLEGRVGGARAAASGPPRIAQRDTAFAPALLVVPVGTTVSFPNQDPFFHNVFSYSEAKRFDLGRYPRGEAKSVEFDEAGVVKVYCEVHKTMRAAVLVVENPYYAVVAADGRFSIADVPPGRYRLVAWHPDASETRAEVTVEDGRASRVELTLR